jgi:predicted RNA-binding Zn-ribbon protein involved in translation (DUF1610 family)
MGNRTTESRRGKEEQTSSSSRRQEEQLDCHKCGIKLRLPPDLGELRRRHRDVFCNAYVDRFRLRCPNCDEQAVHCAVNSIERAINDINADIAHREQNMVSVEEDEFLNAILQEELLELINTLEEKSASKIEVIREAWRKHYWAIWGKLRGQETL